MTVYRSEKLAKHWETQLSTYLSAVVSPQIEVHASGVWNHWHVDIQLNGRKCIVYCGEYHDHQFIFLENNREIAFGRSGDHEIWISAVENWMKFLSLSQLHLVHKFVDENKRRLQKFIEGIINNEPSIKAEAEIKTNFNSNDTGRLFITKGDREISVVSHTPTENFEIEFFWDETFLFKSGVESFEPSSIIKIWVIDGATPSEMENLFPLLKTGKLAKYYEQGRKIEGEFLCSWDGIERFYGYMNFSHTEYRLQLIKELRKGFESK